MPPRKLTQEEKNKLKQEELEKKALEEEEIRIREQEELKQQQERDRIEREERERELLEENGRFEVEGTQISEFLSKREQSYSSSIQQQMNDYIWKRYTNCPVTPDPYCLRDINTYLTLWREDKADTSFESLMGKVQEVFVFMQELTTLQDLDLVYKSKSPYSIVDFSSIIQQIHVILSNKIDSTTLEIMRNPIGMIDDVYGNLKTEVILNESSDNTLCVCLWGNIASNHRMTDVDFNYREFSIEAAQRGLQIPNIALRVIHTIRDLYSPRSRSYSPRPVVPLLDEEDTSKSDLATEQKERSSKSSANSSNKGSTVNVNSQEILTKPQSASSQNEKQGSATETAKEAEPSNTDATEVCEVKQQLEEEFTIEESEIDMRQFSPLGPITILEYIRLPPQPRHMGQWKMQDLEPYVIKQNPYPILQSGQDIAQITPGSKLWPFISVSMSIPDTLVVSEEPKLARWSEELCQWRTDEFTDVKIDLENRKVSFKCNTFSPIALMQDHYLNMPYQGWMVQPMEINTTKLSITGNLHQFEIIIEKDKCRLVKPDLPELSGIINTPLLVNRFIPALRSRGLNLFPAIDAPNYVAISNKDSDIETDVYRDIALLSGCSFNFTWSSWNASCHGNQYILRVCNHDILPDVNEWDLVLVGPKCYRLAMKELSEEFSDNKLSGNTTHSSLYHVLRTDTVADISVDISHTEAIRKLLSAIRPLVFA
ncbi:Protein CASC1 isoform X6 [Oopsacas minuta]|uniref:Protein CASC1 isoform X6 n=1 Tax=Oopsacas minuta TaxID=111878 RepID=A0AAV7JXY8_9METZ|nr:Protein CASC1 isoform X6 [Oopsacas minuta]